MKTFLSGLSLFLGSAVVAAASVSWTASPPGLVASGASVSVGAQNSAFSTTVVVSIFKDGSMVAQNGTGGPGNVQITASTSASATAGSPGSTISWRAEGWSAVNGQYVMDSSTSSSTMVNSSPSAWISGSTTLNVGQPGSWSFGAQDSQANLQRWRFYASSNPNPQWSNTSGGSVSGSYSTSFASPGDYTWNVDCEDSYGLSGSASLTVRVSANTHVLTTSASPSAGGSVSGGGTYTHGASVTVTATPAADYGFVSWSGAASGTSASTTVVMDADKTVTANFAAVPSKTLTTSASPAAGGSVSGAGTYVAGVTVSVTASPNANYTFANWGGDASGSTNPTTVVMNSHKSVTAYFNPINYSLSTSASPSSWGSVSGGGSYNSGSSATVTASAYSGFAFSSWSGDASGSTNPMAVTMSANKSVTAHFIDIESPSTPTGLSSSSVTTTSFTLSWSGSSDNDGVAAYEVRRDGTSLGETGSTSKSVTGLTAGTSYSMTVRARDSSNNWSSWSSPQSISTTPNAPGAPTTSSATAITNTGFTANWSGVATATSYRLDVSTNSSFASYISGYQDSNVGNTTSASVSGLSPGTTYYYRVRAVNAGGTSGSSDTRPVTTTSPPGAPTTSAATAITNNGFTANWSSVAGATSYRLDVSTSNSFASYVSGYQDADVGNTTSASVTGLTAGTTYYYRVRAVSSGGTSGSSDTRSATTTSGPGAPVAGSATSITGTSFTANWSAVSGATSYRLDVSTDAFSTFLSGYNDLNTGNVTSYAVTALAANTVFQYRVRAVNANGTSAHSNAPSVTTAPVISLHPQNQSVATSANASFSVSVTGPAALTYQWQRQPSGGSGFTDLTNGGSYSGATTSTLTVTAATAVMNNDQFRCVVTNATAAVTSNAATLTVGPGGNDSTNQNELNVHLPVGP